MYYVILDSTGNLVESFDNEQQARGLLEQIVRDEPDAAGHLAIIAYDDHGEPVGDAITVAHATAR